MSRGGSWIWIRSAVATLVLLGVPHRAAGEDSDPAAEATRRRTIEEIIVTAQKVEESIQEVPISMSVLEADFLNQEGVTGIDDASRLVPNFSVDAGSFGTTARVRGIETGIINKGFEQAVGLLVDNVVYGRKEYFETALFDLERLEVLRGPQGTLFGKNNSAGLVSIVTANPSDELTGFLDVETGELDRVRLEAAAGGPLVEGIVNVRVAGLIDERDGYMRNTTAEFAPGASERGAEVDRRGLRAKVAFPDLFGVDLVLGYEKFRLDEPSTLPSEIFGASAAQEEILRDFDPNVDLVDGNFVGSIDRRPVSKRDHDTWVANASRRFGDWRADGIFGYALLATEEDHDGDFTPAPAVWALGHDDNIQTTVELRATSPRFDGFYGWPLRTLFGYGLTATEFTAGFFFQRRVLEDSEFTVAADPGVLVPLLVANMGPIAPPLLDVLPTELATESTTGFFEQTSNTVAGFGQLRWHLGERWTLLTGLRVSNDEKDADWVRVFDPPTAVLLRIAFEEFTASRSRSELEVSPKLSVTYDVSESIHLYGAWARGFRPGGFNEFAGTPENLEFERERATSWELGAKTTLLDGAARLDVALFRTTIEDFQVLTDEPGGFLILIAINAGKARTQGVEADLTWLVTDWLELVTSLGFDDTEFLDFPFGGCVDDTEDPDGDGDPRCDHTGDPLPRAPKWAITATPIVKIPFASIPHVREFWPATWRGVGLHARFTTHYEDTQYLREFIDPRLRQGSYFRFNASVGIGDAERGWSVRLVVENLTDEAIAVGAAEFPFIGPPLSKAYLPPRLFFGELRYAF